MTARIGHRIDQRLGDAPHVGDGEVGSEQPAPPRSAEFHRRLGGGIRALHESAELGEEPISLNRGAVLLVGIWPIKTWKQPFEFLHRGVCHEAQPAFTVGRRQRVRFSFPALLAQFVRAGARNVRRT